MGLVVGPDGGEDDGADDHRLPEDEERTGGVRQRDRALRGRCGSERGDRAPGDARRRPAVGRALRRAAAVLPALPEGDRTFIKEDVTDPATVQRVDLRRGTRSPLGGDRGRRRRSLGYVAVVPLAGWSDHVGEIRLVVAPSAAAPGSAGRWPGTPSSQAVEAGLTKLVVEVVADQGCRAPALFTGLGFTGEAVLVDQIRDRDGRAARPAWCWPTTSGGRGRA